MGRPAKYPFTTMKIGEVFFVRGGQNGCKEHGAALNVTKRYGMNFTTRAVPGGLEIKRIDQPSKPKRSAKGKDYTVPEDAYLRFEKALDFYLEAGECRDSARAKALAFIKPRYWAIGPLMRHAQSANLGGNADHALAAFETRLAAIVARPTTNQGTSHD